MQNPGAVEPERITPGGLPGQRADGVRTASPAATCSPYRVWVDEPAAFATDRVCGIRHSFHQHPLMQLPALVQRLFPSGRCRFVSPGIAADSAFSHARAPLDGRSIEDVFRRSEVDWVRPGDGVSISTGTVFYSDVTRRHARVHQLNQVLRRLGLDPRPRGESAVADRLKAPLGRLIGLVRHSLRGHVSPPPGSY